MADSGIHNPLLDFFRRGEVTRDVKELAARGALAPGPLEQLALLVLLVDDADPGIAATAGETLARIPPESLAAFLAREDVPAPMRAFFAARGIAAAPGAAANDEGSLVPGTGADVADQDATADSKASLSTLGVTDRMKLAMRGTREQRAMLIRDPNRLVAAAVLSSPKLTESEVEAFAKMANVSEEVLRIIGTNRNRIKSYSVVSSLTRNPKTPPAISLRFVSRLVLRDIKSLVTDRNVQERLRLAARKILTKSRS